MENFTNTLITTVITFVFSSVLSSLLTYFVTRSKIRLEAAIEYDKDLRNSRLKAYQELWMKLKPLARYAREEPVTYQVIKDTAGNMRDWYFGGGGIYLTKESRVPYFNLKKAMQKIIDNNTLNENTATEIVIELGSKLRDTLANDIGVRKASIIK